MNTAVAVGRIVAEYARGPHDRKVRQLSGPAVLKEGEHAKLEVAPLAIATHEGHLRDGMAAERQL